MRTSTTKTSRSQRCQIRWAATIRARAGAGRSTKSAAALDLRVVAVSGLHDQVFFLHTQLNFSIPRARFRRVPQAVLVAQLFLNLIVDLLDRLLLRYFKETATGFL